MEKEFLPVVLREQILAKVISSSDAILQNPSIFDLPNPCLSHGAAPTSILMATLAITQGNQKYADFAYNLMDRGDQLPHHRASGY